MKLNTETENRIIDAAEKLFYQKGKAGASMQEIADEACINRTLLNYYFRSKDLLFEAVFRKALGKITGRLITILYSDRPFEQIVPETVETIIDVILENPQIPGFILQELSSNPGRMPEVIRELGVRPELVLKRIGEGSRFDVTSGVDPRQIILNLLSLCIFPFAARPIVTELLFMGNEEAYIESMKERRQILPGMILNMANTNKKK